MNVRRKHGGEKRDQTPPSDPPHSRPAPDSPHTPGDLRSTADQHESQRRGQIRWHDPLISPESNEMQQTGEHEHQPQ